jgi:hypothetical protein
MTSFGLLTVMTQTFPCRSYLRVQVSLKPVWAMTRPAPSFGPFAPIDC